MNAHARLASVSRFVGVALAGAFSLAAVQASLPKFPKAEATKLREALTSALAGDDKAAKLLATSARTWGAKYDYDSLLEALREGPLLPKGEPKPRGRGKNAESFEQFESVTTGFTFTAGKDSFRYAVDVPKGYDPSKPAPVLLDPGHAGGAQQDQKGKAGFLGYFRHRAEAGGLADALVVRTEIVEQIGAGGLKGERAEDEVSAVFDACFKDLASRFAVDLDRVWVSGLSQTGFWSWQLGITRPDRFAGIAPMGAVTWGTNGYLPNLASLSVWIAHGDGDTVCPVAQPRATSKQLAELGVRVLYKEIAGGKHDYGTWQHLGDGLAWLAERPRDPYPKKLAHNLQTLAQPWCYWIRVDELAKNGTGKAGQTPTATLSAEIVDQEVRIACEGVEKLTLCLSREMLDLSKPVKVVCNGATKLERVLERDFARAVELALEKCDWRGAFECAVELKP
jgi:predicted esterase